MSDSALQPPQTAEEPSSPSAANGNSSHGAQELESASSPSPVADSAADSPPDELATDGQHGSSSNGSTATPEAVNVDPLPDDQRPKAPSLTRTDLILVAVTLAAIFVLSLIQLYRRYGFDAREIEVLHPAEYRFTLDINTATWVEWLQLDGVGEVLARRIIEYREQHGPFRSIDDLNNVHGIGDAKLDQMRPHLRIDPPAGDAP